MITSPKELQFYIMADRMMNRGYFKEPLKTRIVKLLNPDDTMTFLSLMRKCSFYGHRGGGISRLLGFYYKLRYSRLSKKLGYTIDCYSFGYGLVLHHYGTIVVGSGSHIGNYANILHGCTISRGSSSIGDFFFMGSGSIITKSVKIENNVKVASNSVVNRSFSANVVIAGMPAETKKHDETTWVEMYSGNKGEWVQRWKRVEELRIQMGV